MNKRPSIIVADDNHDAADSLAQLLFLMGYEAIAVYNGHQAVNASRERQPALVILDVQMPIMGGVEAARAIRAERSPPPVLASLTGLRGRGLSKEAGWDAFDAHLSKPLRMSELSALLADVLEMPD